MNNPVSGIGMTSQRTRDRLITRLQEQGITNNKVLEVMRELPRHLFVDEALASRAYEDTALPIGYSQTISQPYIVAKMTEVLLSAEVPGKVLEIGTGSGYQAAVLSRLIDRVYTVERIEPLISRARKIFQQLRIRNIRIKHDDGNLGWDDYGPYNAIIVTAAPGDIPESLIEQLSIGGRLVIPVGQRGEQQLISLTRTENGYTKELLDRVSFVPLLAGSA